MLSPVYSKDQTETRDAIEKLHGFINLYPESEFLPEASNLVQELDFKLEKKAFEIAKPYNEIAGYTDEFDASIKAFYNVLCDFSGCSFKTGTKSNNLDSAYYM